MVDVAPDFTGAQLAVGHGFQVVGVVVESDQVQQFVFDGGLVIVFVIVDLVFIVTGEPVEGVVEGDLGLAAG